VFGLVGHDATHLQCYTLWLAHVVIIEYRHELAARFADDRVDGAGIAPVFRMKDNSDFGILLCEAT
jgi:hypothetical protein